MKGKTLFLMMAVLAVAVVCLVGCSSSGGASNSANSSASSAAATKSSMASSEANSDYAVTIDGATFGADYQGAKTIVVNYTWTNNSEKATSFMVAIDAQAFQNGVQLENAIGSGVDSQATMKDLKPGASTTVQRAYVLDDNSNVTVECTELISFDDTLLAEATFPVQ